MGMNARYTFKNLVKDRFLLRHADIEGNERADRLAKEGAALDGCDAAFSQAFLQVKK